MPLIDRDLEETFDDGDMSEPRGIIENDREQLIRNAVSNPADTNASTAASRLNARAERTNASATAPSTTLSNSNDGVFANLNAKPEIGEKFEEQPPVSRTRQKMLKILMASFI